MWGIARQYGIDPNYLIDVNRKSLQDQGISDPSLIYAGKLVLIPRTPDRDSTTPPPEPLAQHYLGKWGGVLFGDFEQLTRPNFGGRSLAWDLQGWCDDPPTVGHGHETVIDAVRGLKATFEYYYVLKSKGSSALVEYSKGVYAGLVTGFTNGDPPITLDNYAGLAKCEVFPFALHQPFGLSTTALAGLSGSVALCGPGKFTGEPWTAEFSNSPGLWTALVQGQISIGLAVDVSSEMIASYFRTSPIMPWNQTDRDNAYNYISTYGR